ncbi:hypothetical protein ACFXKD_21185 [Nocardiopsis aegyptia]|uniref:SbtR family transcriptional regulator n=1 Tax=Nocardiopsis aegyptia TaxID=220378 RepID=UPI00366EDF63
MDLRPNEVAREAGVGVATVYRRAQASGAVRPDISMAHVRHLVCGIEHAIRLGPPEDRDVLADTLVTGLRAR